MSTQKIVKYFLSQRPKKTMLPTVNPAIDHPKPLFADSWLKLHGSVCSVNTRARAKCPTNAKMYTAIAQPIITEARIARIEGMPYCSGNHPPDNFSFLIASVYHDNHTNAGHSLFYRSIGQLPVSNLTHQIPISNDQHTIFISRNHGQLQVHFVQTAILYSTGL